MIRRPPRSTPSDSSAASDVYKRQGLWWTNVLNLAVPPQRLRPDTQPEHQDPVSHMGLSPSSCASHHSASSCLCASLSFGRCRGCQWAAALPCLRLHPCQACRVPPSYGAGSAKTAPPPDRPTDLARREGAEQAWLSFCLEPALQSCAYIASCSCSSCLKAGCA